MGRIVLVAVAQLALFEATLQSSIHWRESSEELCLVGLSLLSLIASAWVVIPLLSGIGSRVPRMILTGLSALGMFLLLHTADYFHSWHLRPNLGLYREPDWVAQHPGFQRELRARIQANLWRQPNAPARP
jgi:hypothetical protein